LFSVALSVEPNYASYYQPVIKIGALLENFTDALSKFELMKAIFPYSCDLDMLGIDLCLKLGKVEEATAFLQRAYLLKPAEREELRTMIDEFPSGRTIH
jgi:hypothetical protein